MIKLHAPHIYLAGPIGKEEMHDENLARAIDVAHELTDLGFVVHVPHLSIVWNRKHPRHYEDWMAIDFAVIVRCDCLYRMNGVSPGADREVAFAKERDISVLYSLDSALSFLDDYKGPRDSA